MVHVAMCVYNSRCDKLLYVLLTGGILKWLTLKIMFVYVLFYVCVGIGFVDWLDKSFVYEKFWNVHLLITRFDCP